MRAVALAITSAVSVARVMRIEVLTARLPFRFSFGHALAERKDSTNVFVRVRLDDGSVGHGEGVLRDAAPALREALSTSRRRLPGVVARLPLAIRAPSRPR